MDAVVEGDWGAWAIEIKTGKFTLKDLSGLMEFVRRFPRFKPLVVCSSDGIPLAERAGVHVMDWRTFLLKGLNCGNYR